MLDNVLDFSFILFGFNEYSIVYSASSIYFSPFWISSLTESDSSRFIIKSSCYNTLSRY
jgi:hypothetical protein